MIESRVVGVLYPGNMGSALASSLVRSGHRVVWPSEGRSSESLNRAQEAGLTDVRSIQQLVHEADVILSVCPQVAAFEVSRSVAQYEPGGVFVEMNSISPAAMNEIHSNLQKIGTSVVDASIFGPPPGGDVRPRVYMAGDECDAVTRIFDVRDVDCIAMDAPIPTPSALKMAQSAWVKGRFALLLTIRAYALQQKIEDHLIEEWIRSDPDLIGLSEKAASEAFLKSGRWIDEMKHVVESLESCGVSGDIHMAAKRVYERISSGLTRLGGAFDIRGIADALVDEGGSTHES